VIDKINTHRTRRGYSNFSPGSSFLKNNSQFAAFLPAGRQAHSFARPPSSSLEGLPAIACRKAWQAGEVGWVDLHFVLIHSSLTTYFIYVILRNNK